MPYRKPGYAVRTVADGTIPAEGGWMLLAVGRRVTLIVEESAFGPRVCAEAWAAYRRMLGEVVLVA